MSTEGHEGPRRKPLRDHDLVCPRRAGENTFFGRATKDHEENLCGIMIWSVHEGRGRTPFLSTKGHEGPRRKPLRDHDLVCPRRAGENTFFDPRRATKDHEENLCGIMIWSVHEGRGRTPFLIHEGPRRTTEKTFARIMIWSVHEGRGRTPFFGLSTKGGGEHLFEGPRRTTKEKTFARIIFGLSTKGGGEHLFCP